MGQFFLIMRSISITTTIALSITLLAAPSYGGVLTRDRIGLARRITSLTEDIVGRLQDIEEEDGTYIGMPGLLRNLKNILKTCEDLNFLRDAVQLMKEDVWGGDWELLDEGDLLDEIDELISDGDIDEYYEAFGELNWAASVYLDENEGFISASVSGFGVSASAGTSAFGVSASAGTSAFGVSASAGTSGFGVSASPTRPEDFW